MHHMKLEVLPGRGGIYIGDLDISTDPVMRLHQQIASSPDFVKAAEEANRRLNLEYAERFVDLFQNGFVSRMRSRIQRRNLNGGIVTPEFSEDEIARVLSKAGLYSDVGAASADISNVLQTDFTYVAQRYGENLVRYTWIGNPQNHKYRLHKSVEHRIK